MDSIDIESATILQVELMNENDLKDLNESDLITNPEDNTILLEETDDVDEEGMVYTDDSLIMQDDVLADPVEDAEALDVKSPENVEIICENNKETYDVPSPNTNFLDGLTVNSFISTALDRTTMEGFSGNAFNDNAPAAKGSDSSDEIIDKENRCRMCLGQDELSHIFSLEEPETIAQKVMAICPRVKITKSDSFPQFICTNCLQSVNVAFHFKVLCEATDKQLKAELTVQKAKARRSVKYTIEIDSDFSEPEEKTEDDDFKVSEVSQESDIDFDSESDFDNTKRRSKRVRRRIAPSKKRKTKNQGSTSKSSKTPDDDDEMMDLSSNSEQSPKRRKQNYNNGNDDNKLGCDICNRKFATKKSLARHKRVHSDHQYVCEYCNRSFKHLGSYQTHITKHQSESGLKCQLCQKMFATRNEHRKHMTDIHNDGEPIMMCQKCKRTFKTQSRLDKHRETKCPGYELTANRKRAEIENITLGKDLFKCVAPLTTTYWSDSFSD